MTPTMVRPTRSLAATPSWSCLAFVVEVCQHRLDPYSLSPSSGYLLLASILTKDSAGTPKLL